MRMKPWQVSAENANDIPLSKHSRVNASHAGLGLILETESDNMVQNHQLRGHSDTRSYNTALRTDPLLDELAPLMQLFNSLCVKVREKSEQGRGREKRCPTCREPSYHQPLTSPPPSNILSTTFQSQSDFFFLNDIQQTLEPVSQL